ncbi:hypothetical protein ACI784_23065 [Geodermatophilus sp. SYSU D01186]
MTEAPRTPTPPTAELPVSGAVPSGEPTPPDPTVTGPIETGPPPVPFPGLEGATAAGATAVPPSTQPPAPVQPPAPEPPVPAPAPAPAGAPAAEGHQPTTPVTGRPRIGPRRPGTLTRMGPWAPVAGALLGLVAGIVVSLLLGGVAEAFSERLALVFLTVGLTMLGAAGALLADEVRLVRRGAREAGIRPAWVEATANLINGLTPARLLLLSSAFVLFLAAYVA